METPVSSKVVVVVEAWPQAFAVHLRDWVRFFDARSRYTLKIYAFVVTRLSSQHEALTRIM